MKKRHKVCTAPLTYKHFITSLIQLPHILLEFPEKLDIDVITKGKKE